METSSPHEIFLSHSGKQKGFVKDLCRRLETEGYSVFFDQNHDSLPPGGDFPPLIISAANACKLALIVFSDDFLSSKWPMLELCLLADRLPLQSNSRSDVPPSAPPFTILPLFFELCPEDIKEKKNLTKWRKKWMEFEKKDGRMSAVKCEEAVTKVAHLSGIVRGPKSEQGEGTYIEKVVDGIFSILCPRNLVALRYGVDPDKKYVGEERLCKAILYTFRKLEEDQQRSTEIAFLGMYGIGGSGKSTICDFLRKFVFEEFRGKAIHLSLPTELRANDDNCKEVKDQYVKLLTMLIPDKKRDFPLMALEELYNQLHLRATSNHKMFLVLDNISPSNYDIYKRMIKVLLSSNVLGHGSRVMVVAQSSAILKDLLMECKHNHSIIEVPRLSGEDAAELVRNQFPSIKDDLVTQLLDKFRFSSMYIPFVFEQIGIFLRRRCCNNLKELEPFWKMVEEGKKDAIEKLVDMNFKQLSEDLRLLFFDIALFIIPAGYSNLEDAIPILCDMHNITKAFKFKMEWKIEDLKNYCILSTSWGGKLQMHDIFIEYARSKPENSNVYVNEPSLNIADLLARNDQYLHPRTIDLKFPVARTICIGTCKGSIDCQPNVAAPLIACDKEVCLHVEVGSTARALFVRNRSEVCLRVEVGSTARVRNRSEYSRCNSVLSGNMSSLACFQTENMQQVAFGEDDVNLVRLELRNESGLTSSIVVNHNIQKQLMSNFVFSSRCLRVLRLINVDIGRRIEIVGSYFPVLEELEIQKKLQDPMDVSIHRTPKLKRLVIQGHCYGHRWFHRILIPGNERKLEIGVGDCPELEEVVLDRSFDRVEVVGLLPRSLRYLAIESYGRGSEEFIPTKWIGSSSHQLSALEKLELSCSNSKGINSLAFTEKCFGCLPALKQMRLDECESLTHLTLEPSCFPNLEVLYVWHCEKLQVLEGLEHILWMEQMRDLCLDDLPQLQVECDLSRWNNYSSNKCEGSWDNLQLDYIHIEDCPGVKIYFDGLEAYKHLSEIWMEGAGGIIISMAEKMEEEDGSSSSSAAAAADGCINIAAIRKEEEGASNKEEEEDGSSGISMAEKEEEDGCIKIAITKVLSLCMLVDNDKCCSNVEESTIVASSSSSSSSSATSTSTSTTAAAAALYHHHHRLMFSEGKFTSLSWLHLERVDHLREIEGIHHLPELGYLELTELPNLTRVSGTRWPTYINKIEIKKCPMLVEIPPLDNNLPRLWYLNLSELPNLTRVSGTRWPTSIHKIKINECPMLVEIPPLDNNLRYRMLVELSLSELPNLTRVSGTWPTRGSIEIKKCPMLVEIPDLETLPQGTDLQIRDCHERIQKMFQEFKSCRSETFYQTSD